MLDLVFLKTNVAVQRSHAGDASLVESGDVTAHSALIKYSLGNMLSEFPAVSMITHVLCVPCHK